MEEDSSPSEKRKNHKGWRILRYDPTNCNEINSSPFIRQCFEDVSCLGLCQRVGEVGLHEQITDWIATNLKWEKAIIAGIEFTDLKQYRPFLKSPYREVHSHIIPFKYPLEKYVPLMKVVIKFFTYERIFSGLYGYHIRMLMHFTTLKPLNMCNYLCRSLIKMSEKVQMKGK